MEVTAMAMDIRRRAVPSAWSLMEQPWHSFSSPALNGGSTGIHQVPVNVWEAKEAYQIAMVAPGADPEALNITAVGGTLTVEGELRVETPEGAAAVWQEFG